MPAFLPIFVLSACSGSDPVAPTPPPDAQPQAPEAPAHGTAPEPTTGPEISVPLGARGLLEVSGNDLTLIFPAEEVPGFDPTKGVPGAYTIADQLVSFGAKGVQARFNGPSLVLTEWCSDNGKPLYRLQGRITMPSPPPREVMALPEEGILSFVQVGDAPPTPAFPPAGATEAASGDLDADGKPDALLVRRTEGCEKGTLDLVDTQGSANVRCCP